MSSVRRKTKGKIIPERGDLIAFYPQRWYQRIIAYFDGKYCHIAIALSEKLFLSQGFLGLTIESLDEEKYENLRYDIFGIDISDEKKEELIKFLLSLMPIVKYDFLGILRFLFRWFLNIPQRFFCSEIIAFGLYYIGLLPETLYLSPLQLVNQDFIYEKTKNKISNKKGGEIKYEKR